MIINLKYGWCLRDFKYRKTCTLYTEVSKNVLKSLLQSGFYKLWYRSYFYKMFYISKKSSSISTYRTSCSFSNQGRVVYRRFKMSRLFCKHFSANGFY